MENLDHIHEVIDQQLPFVIDPITKRIVEQSENLTVPQHAKNSERFTFSIPDRYIEGHDMSEVNQVLIHYRNIDQKTGALSAGIYKVKDLAVDDDSVTLSWLLGDEATYYAGGLIFSIHFACITEDGKIAYNLPTLTYSKISVGETIWNSEDVEKKYPDIIAELEGRISALEKGVPMKKWDVVAYGNTVTLNYRTVDGTLHKDVITFNADGYPVSLVHDGFEATGTWLETSDE